MSDFQSRESSSDVGKNIARYQNSPDFRRREDYLPTSGRILHDIGRTLPTWEEKRSDIRSDGPPPWSPDFSPDDSDVRPNRIWFCILGNKNQAIWMTSKAGLTWGESHLDTDGVASIQLASQDLKVIGNHCVCRGARYVSSDCRCCARLIFTNTRQ